jgi:hypothetical protein
MTHEITLEILRTDPEAPKVQPWQLRKLQESNCYDVPTSSLEADLKLQALNRALSDSDGAKNVRIPYTDEPVALTTLLEYGSQQHRKYGVLWYLRFCDLLVIDLDDCDDRGDDFVSISTSRESFESKLRAAGVLGPQFCWCVTRTPRGWHMYLVSHFVPFNSDQAITLLASFPGADQWYARYTLHNGFKIRVSPKVQDGFDTSCLEWDADRTYFIGDGVAHPMQLERINWIRRLKEWHQKPDHIGPCLKLTHLAIGGAPGSFFTETFLQNVLQGHASDRATITPNLWRVKRHLLQYLLQRDAQHPLCHVLRRVQMRRPQKLIIDTKRYYVALDIFTSTFYICFRHLAMIDIDTTDDSNDIKRQEECLLALPGGPHCYEVHNTRKGRHIFCLSQAFVAGSDPAIQFLAQNGCDPKYAEYAKVRGWSVRLNHKKGENHLETIYTNIRRIGDTRAATPELVNDLSALKQHLPKYNKAMPSSMA